MRKPGMAKYTSWRGPWSHEPAEKHIEFWGRDAQAQREFIAIAIANDDQRALRLARKHLQDAEARVAEAVARLEAERGCARGAE